MAFLVLFYFLIRVPFLRDYPVYYDSFEYVSFASEVNITNFRQLILASHQPIHAFYLFSIYIIKQLFPISPQQIPVLISFLSGLGTVIIFYLWIKKAENHRIAFTSSLYLLSFPYFFAATANILYESQLLFFQILSLYLLWNGVKKRKIKLIIFSAVTFFCSVLIFSGSLLLFPAIIYILKPLKKREKKQYLLFFSYISLSLLFLSEVLILGNISTVINKYLSHSLDFTSTSGGLPVFIARIMRNIFVQTAANLSISGGVIFIGAVIFNFWKNKKMRPPIFLLTIILGILMQYWHAGLYGRLSMFIIFPAAYLLAKTFRSRAITLLILLSIAATTFHYAKAAGDKPPVYAYAARIKNYQNDRILAVVTSDYNRFLYEREKQPLFVIRDNNGIYKDLRNFIDYHLNNNYQVVLDLPALAYPYLQFDGDFYHVIPSVKSRREEMERITDNYRINPFIVKRDQAVVIYSIEKQARGRNRLFLLNNQESGDYFPERSAFYKDPLVILGRKFQSLIDFNKFDR